MDAFQRGDAALLVWCVRVSLLAVAFTRGSPVHTPVWAVSILLGQEIFTQSCVYQAGGVFIFHCFGEI